MKYREGLRWMMLAGMVAMSLISMRWFGGAVTADSPNSERPVSNAGANNNRAAITFDAAWGNDKTREILDILDIYDVKATFFLTGFWAEANPELVREIYNRGHEIGNHSTTHQDMTRMTQEEIITDIEQTSTIIEGMTGERPKVFRVPFGSYNATVIRTANALGYDVIQWDIDTRDYRDDSVEEIMKRVDAHAKDGSIILFQNNSKNVTGALPQVLSQFSEKGLRAVTVSELIGEENYMVDINGMLVRVQQ